MMDAEARDKIIALLVSIEPKESAQTLRRNSREAVSRLLGCTLEEATRTVQELEEERAVEFELTPRGGPLSVQEEVPRAKFRWAAIRKRA